ncbi:hydroxyneurosporene methyltransferase [Burkholderia ubonensis]|uniref:Hydroxyneurosporene methyltransferase n=1 Tax=Burkholderia ubonensis TaxID=101571 RepID=A0AB73G1B4_9BURK|nr:hydroxyneurosporene methyltransferase [Burkholderia ubonensis]KVC84905.1 hydroxyneurosporene methyltransferase [Burkholderia ubonensis]KVK74757.1 hydroxyneurosporene methyltransferase [Burkholderia ubonensis]KVL60573.1 hydroxyneurosporene methyltransferase [Burkholderia ubonensis]KVL76508.1 hydroxyneurosporene methyltransferase [Burkholderia ubonensis]
MFSQGGSTVNKDVEHVTSLIFGRWRSQVLYAGATLGIFDRLDTEHRRTAEEVAQEAGLNGPLLYRLMRALGAINMLEESESGGFRLTSHGALLQSNSPGSLLYMTLLEEGPEHYAIWTHLADMVRNGRQNGFVLEYGKSAFEYAHDNEAYANIFRSAMSSFSGVQSALALEALASVDLSDVNIWCDVAGGEGHLLCSILEKYDHLTGIVFDMPAVVRKGEGTWSSRLQVQNRCSYIGGDMFQSVPKADAYSLKMILHDWNDEECITILKNLRESATGPGRIFIVEHIVQGPRDPHFSKLYDIHMMCWGSGRERTEDEYASLLAAAGWKYKTSHYPESRLMGVVEGVSA